MHVLISIAIFVTLGLGFVLVNLLVGKLVRPSLPNREKLEIYECGEPTIGSSWVQFDLRFYIVALFYLVFDVEVALMYPWAIVYRQFPLEALVLGLPFIGLVILGFAYEWKAGSLTWVRSSLGGPVQHAGQRAEMARLARVDPELLEAMKEAADAARTPGSLASAASPPQL